MESRGSNIRKSFRIVLHITVKITTHTVKEIPYASGHFDSSEDKNHMSVIESGSKCTSVKYPREA